MNFKSCITAIININQTITFILPVTPKSSHGVLKVWCTIYPTEKTTYIFLTQLIFDIVMNQRIKIPKDLWQRAYCEFPIIDNWKPELKFICNGFFWISNIFLLNINSYLNVYLSKCMFRGKVNLHQQILITSYSWNKEKGQLHRIHCKSNSIVHD
jgi:hypothetical protein